MKVFKEACVSAALFVALSMAFGMTKDPSEALLAWATGVLFIELTHKKREVK